jgi:hypothetical protein
VAHHVEIKLGSNDLSKVWNHIMQFPMRILCALMHIWYYYLE